MDNLQDKAVGWHAFVKDLQVNNSPKDQRFSLQTQRILRVELDGRLWIRIGSMIAYQGDIKFERESMLQHGLGNFLYKAFTGEMAVLASAKGQGDLYLAHSSRHVAILELHNEVINVQGSDLLAFEDTISYDIKTMNTLAGAMAGGLFYVTLQGTGLAAITSCGTPLALKCSAKNPVICDPSAALAWSDNLSPQIKTDISLKNLIGRGNGESFQMKFAEDGYVLVQPYEEVVSVK